ncbi:MAG: RAD55 family ATPase [Candidatus Aminicenantaceae bacterium]
MDRFDAVQANVLNLKIHDKKIKLDIPKGFFRGIYKRIDDLLSKGLTIYEIMEILKKENFPDVENTKIRLIADWIGDFRLDAQKNINKAWAGVLEEQAMNLIHDHKVKGEEHTQKIKQLYQEAERLKSSDKEEKENVKDCSLAALADQYSEWREKRKNRKYLGFEISDFPELTQTLSGIREILVIAGLPGKGKSTLALQLANNVYRNGTNVFYLDLENGRFTVMDRKVSQDANINPGENLEYDEPIIIDAIQKFKECEGFIIPKLDKLNLETLQNMIRELRETTKQKETLLIVDSLQKLPFPDLKDRRDHIDAWLRNFEQLNRDDPDLSIILISELSRQGLPKESGDIEYTAHFYLKLFQPEPEKNPKKHILWVEKSRDTKSQFGIILYRNDNWTFTEEERIHERPEE